MPTDLATVEQARQQADVSRDDLIRAVREAVAAGLPILHVAQAAGVTRQTVYRWIDPA